MRAGFRQEARKRGKSSPNEPRIQTGDKEKKEKQSE
jgi:hypothetical protein